MILMIIIITLIIVIIGNSSYPIIEMLSFKIVISSYVAFYNIISTTTV